MKSMQAPLLSLRLSRCHGGLRGRLAAVFACALALALSGTGASAQTVTTSMLGGFVHTPDGEPLEGVRVAVEEVRTGFVHSLRTGEDGRFEFRLLPPGTYAVLAERLGYRPQVLVDVPLLPGRSSQVTLRLEPAEPPVMSIDSVDHPGRLVASSRAGFSRWLDGLEIHAPRERQSESALALLATFASDDFVVEGLPAMLSRYAAEGFAFDPLLPRGTSEPALLPQALAPLAGAELVTNLADVELGGAAGAQLFTYGRRGTRDFGFRVWGSGADADLPLGYFSDATAGTYDLARGGAEVSGPIVRDTAVFVLGAEWRTRARMHPRAWRLDELAGAEAGAAARDLADLSLLSLTLPFVEERDEIAAWGRFDWRVADGHDLAAFADFGLGRAADPISPLRATAGTSGAGDALDARAGIALRSILSPRFANEVRAGFVRSTHEEALPGELELQPFAAVGIPATSILDGVLSFGADAAVPYALGRTGILAEQALLMTFGSHVLKVGFAADWESREETGAHARAGSFRFGGAAELAGRRGAFTQSVGALPSASWSTLETGAFLQDTWRPAPGVELLAGVRLSAERLPDDVTRNAEWFRLTGLSSDSADTRLTQIAPRVAFRWNVRDLDRWFVRAGFGLYHDDVASSLIAERLTHDGGVRIRRAFGDLSSWPAPPDSVAAPVFGPALTLFAPEIRAPRSTRASFGVSRLGATSVHLSATYRHTDFLPARRDLNLATSPAGQDQHGRPIFGELAQHGALVAAVPGTNRRFDGFDVVSAIESTAFSDYWDATVLLERRLGSYVRFAASYTFSRTRDNWLAHPGVAPFDAFEPTLGESMSRGDWAEGVSDFDVPHRASIAAEVELPLPLAPSFELVYRARSGAPFTPGFQPGVDVNGDYAGNDPAFIDEAIAGVPELLDDWECLREQTGAFADRNSCRGDMLQFLDLRLGVRLGSLGGSHARLYADALNLLGNELARPDAALYLVDPDAALDVDESAGTVTLPLIANPGFGRPVRSIESGRIFRLGLEVSF